MTDVAEYIAGSDQKDADSLPRLQIDISTAPPELVVTGLSAPGDDQARIVIIERCTDMREGHWDEERRGTLAEITAMHWPCSIPTHSRCVYYRMRIVMP